MDTPSNSEEMPLNAPDGDLKERKPEIPSSKRDRVKELYEQFFGKPALPIDAITHGRKLGRQAAQLFSDRASDVLRGFREGITDIRERRGGVDG